MKKIFVLIIWLSLGIIGFSLYSVFNVHNSSKQVLSFITFKTLTMLNSLHDMLQSKLSDQKKTVYETKYDILQEQYNDLFKKYIELQAAINFNKETKELLEFQKRYDLNDAKLVRVIAKTFSPTEHSLLINKGKQDGIKENMIAVYKLQILGKVTNVYDFYSKVLCITDKKCNIASFTNTTETHGITTGTNVINQCQLNYVSYTSKILDKDIVFCSGEGTVFPEGFCLGTIQEQSLTKDSAYYNISIKPLIDFTTLKFCFLTDCSKIKLF